MLLAQLASVSADSTLASTAASPTNYGVIVASILLVVGVLWLVFQSLGTRKPAAPSAPTLSARPAAVPKRHPASPTASSPRPSDTPSVPLAATPALPQPAPSIPIPLPQVVVVETPIEQPSQPKYIGYYPTNVFAQTEPWDFPYVAMPKPGSVIKFPRKGRVGRKGYKEAALFAELQRHFAPSLQLFDDRFILIEAGTNPYEPDITLIDEKNNLNLFLDIEIDEPYEGSNDIATRRATHYQGADTARDSAFTRRGWIVIRFAEIQVHQQLLSCCRLIADVIASVNPQFQVPSALTQAPILLPVPQWSKAQAGAWSQARYREQYLKIPGFGQTPDTVRASALQETPADEAAEKEVTAEQLARPAPPSPAVNTPAAILSQAIATDQYASFIFQGDPTITKPSSVQGNTLHAYCFVRNVNRTFPIAQIEHLLIKSQPFTARLKAKETTLGRVKTLMHQATQYHKLIWMHYTKSSFDTSFLDVDSDGQLIFTTLPRDSTRTISGIKRPSQVRNPTEPDTYKLNDEDHFIAYCHLKQDPGRSFRYDRINELAILDIPLSPIQLTQR
jgi:hypothetical protein